MPQKFPSNHSQPHPTNAVESTRSFTSTASAAQTWHAIIELALARFIDHERTADQFDDCSQSCVSTRALGRGSEGNIWIIKWNFRFDNFIFIHHRLIQLDIIVRLVSESIARVTPFTRNEYDVRLWLRKVLENDVKQWTVIKCQFKCARHPLHLFICYCAGHDACPWLPLTACLRIINLLKCLNVVHPNPDRGKLQLSLFPLATFMQICNS